MSSAEAKIEEAYAMYLAPTAGGAAYIEQLVAVGHKLREVEAMGVDVPALAEARRGPGSGCFSAASARRYLRFARHATAIRAAQLTRVMEADRLALEHEYTPNRNDAGPPTAPAKPDVTGMVSEHESSIFNDMRRLPAADQGDFVASLFARLTHLHRLFEGPSC